MVYQDEVCRGDRGGRNIVDAEEVELVGVELGQLEGVEIFGTEVEVGPGSQDESNGRRRIILDFGRQIRVGDGTCHGVEICVKYGQIQVDLQSRRNGLTSSFVPHDNSPL